MNENGTSNTISIVQKDNLVVEPVEDTATTICLNSKVDGKQPSLQDRIYDVDGCSTAVTTGFLPSIAEPIIFDDYNQRIPKDQDCIGTLTTNIGSSTPRTGIKIIEPKVEQIGNIYPDTENFKNRTMGRVYSDEGLSPTINCCGGGDREPKIIDDIYANREAREYEDYSPALRSERGGLKVSETQQYRIRKLTPRECFRLMDVSESDIDKIQTSGVSNSQQYKMAGNSIVVSCLYHLFRKMFVEPENEQEQLTIFDMLR